MMMLWLFMVPDKLILVFEMFASRLDRSCQRSVDFKVFSEAPCGLKPLSSKGMNPATIMNIDKMTEVAKQYRCQGLAWVKVVDGDLNGPVAKFLTGIQGGYDALGLEDKGLSSPCS